MSTLASQTHFTQVVNRLEHIAYLHRACAQIQAGWNVKLNQMEYKLSLASHTFDDMEQVAKLDRHLVALTRVDSYQGTIPVAWMHALKQLDREANQSTMISGIYHVIKPYLATLYNQLLNQLDPILDINLKRVLNHYMPLLRQQIAWANDQETPSDHPLLNTLTQVLKQPQGESLPRQEGVWQPQDRVNRAVRPENMPRATPGALRLLPKNAWTDPQGIGLAAHNQIHGEFTTMELMSRCLYEHPDMPAAFHLDMARHASDESRHARIFMELAALYDVQYGDYPVYTLTYDAYYEFDPACPMGSKQELLWRLILRGTIDEGLALDDLAYQAKSRDFLDQQKFANACRYILADETFHVQGALKWSRYLCDRNEEQVTQQRETARQFLNTKLCERRLAYEQQHAKQVEEELAYRREVAAAKRPEIPYTRVLNRSARMAAGYTEADINQVLQWGYADAK